MQKTGKILATIYHPVFMVFYLSIFFIYSDQDSKLFENRFLVLGEVFVLSVLLPLFTVYLISGDLSLEDRKKRSLPIALTAILYALGSAAFYVHIFNVDEGMFFIPMCQFAIGIAIVWIINSMYKISLHATGIGGILLYYIWMLEIAWDDRSWILFSLLLIFILPAIFIVPVQRVQSGAHTKGQVVAGLILGLLVSFLMIAVMWVMSRSYTNG